MHITKLNFERLAKFLKQGGVVPSINDGNKRWCCPKVTRRTMSKTLAELYQLWDKLGDIPVSEGVTKADAGTVEESFLHFPVGTHCEEIWHWFEAQNPDFVVGELLRGIRRECAVA